MYHAWLRRRVVRWNVDRPRQDWLPPGYNPDGSDTNFIPLEPAFSRPGMCGAGHRAAYVYDTGETERWCGPHLAERIRRIWVTKPTNAARDDE